MTVSRPTDVPDEWSTDANYPAGSDPWSGTPTRVEPDAGDQATGFIPGTRGPAQTFNWLIGLVTAWVKYVAAIIDSNEEHTYQTPKTITRDVPLAPVGAMDTGGGPQWLQSFTGDNRYRSQVNTGIVRIPVHVRQGEKLVSARVSVNPGTARATGANRIQANVRLTSTGWGSTGGTSVANGATVDATDDGTTNQQVVTITLAAGGHTMASGETAYVEVIAGNDGGTNKDDLFAVQVTIVSPGPR